MRKKISLIVVVLALALLFAWSRIRVIEMGYEISSLKDQVAAMERVNGLLRSRVAKAKSTSQFDLWTKQFGFVSPGRSQVIFMEAE